MYMPRAFEVVDIEKSLALISQNALGTLVVNNDNGFEVNHLPFVADVTDTNRVRLRAHIPRANGLSSMLDRGRQCVVTFHGPQGYISPSWYATKREHGKVVPTWNYAVVHVHGEVTLVDDRDWVRQQLQALTEHNEVARAEPWAMSDAPEDYLEKQFGALVGVQVLASRIEAKTKASQNQPKANQSSILLALTSEQPDSELYKLVRETLVPGD
jgi:transcriptional regulator